MSEFKTRVESVAPVQPREQTPAQLRELTPWRAQAARPVERIPTDFFGRANWYIGQLRQSWLANPAIAPAQPWWLAVGFISNVPSPFSAQDMGLGVVLIQAPACYTGPAPSDDYTTARPVTSVAATFIQNISRKADVVTVATPVAHRLLVGEGVAISGVGGAATSLNGTFAVAAVPSPTEFTFAQSGPDESGAGGNFSPAIGA